MSPSIHAPGARAPVPSPPGFGGPATWRPIWYAGVVLVLGLLGTWRAQPAVRHSLLPERTAAPDTSALSAEIRQAGGHVLLHLSGWAKPAVLEDMSAAGLGPLEGYEQLERLDSIGMNIVGGTIPPGGLDRIAALRYVLRMEPVP